MSSSLSAVSLMNLRRSSRIAKMYDDNFSYCEKDDRTLSNFRPSTPLRRSSRIAKMYNDNFSYCEKDGREVHEEFFHPANDASEFLNTIENEVIEFLTDMAHKRKTHETKRRHQRNRPKYPTRGSDRIAMMPYVDYEALNRGISVKEQQQQWEEKYMNLRRSSRLQHVPRVFYEE